MYLIGRKKVGKKRQILLPVTNSFAGYLFYRRLSFNDEYSYRIFFCKRKYLVFSNLKIPVAYLFDFEFDKNF